MTIGMSLEELAVDAEGRDSFGVLAGSFEPLEGFVDFTTSTWLPSMSSVANTSPSGSSVGLQIFAPVLVAVTSRK